MNRGAQCVTEDDSLLDAAKLMKDYGIGSVPVQGADGELTGIITDRDIVISVIADGKDASSVKAKDFAHGKVHTVDADDAIDSVLTLMRRHQVKRVPVLSDGRLVGMISESDLVAELSGDQVAHFAEGVYRKD